MTQPQTDKPAKWDDRGDGWTTVRLFGIDIGSGGEIDWQTWPRALFAEFWPSPMGHALLPGLPGPTECNLLEIDIIDGRATTWWVADNGERAHVRTQPLDLQRMLKWHSRYSSGPALETTAYPDLQTASQAAAPSDRGAAI